MVKPKFIKATHLLHTLTLKHALTLDRTGKQALLRLNSRREAHKRARCWIQR